MIVTKTGAAIMETTTAAETATIAAASTSTMATMLITATVAAQKQSQTN